ncbi:ECF RNA polymerase sigma factor SigW [subsurface metagenome]
MVEERVTRDEGIYILLEKIKEGDREAFMTVTSLYQKKVFLLAFSFFHNREDAMDVVQETFLRLYQKVNMFQKGKSFQNWLLQIAKNICIDYYRKNYQKKREFETGKSIEEMNLPLQNKENPLDSVDLKTIFSRCLKKITEKQRMIFVMKHYNQLKYREISQILNISLGTVKSLHFKAVQNLRAVMAPYLGRQE